ncbi:hypothetical protein ABK040_001804 [Willaertia magna]
MSAIEKEFHLAQDFIQNGPKDEEPSNENKLKFYALFKQATQGPNTSTKRPAAYDLINRAKFDAYKKLGNMSKEDAMKAYIKTLDQSTPNWRDYMNKKQGSNNKVEPKVVETLPVVNSNSNNNNTGNKTAVVNSSSVFRSDLLKGKVALVTGGGSGICKSITEELMRHGANTIIVSRTLEKLEKASKELMEKVNNGTVCAYFTADVRDYNALTKAVEQGLERFGRIDILVNGSAGNFLCPASKLSTNAFKTVIDIDTVGTFNASKIVYDKWMKANGGSIINLSMTLHNQATIMQVHAGCAKAAIDTMTKHLAVEWGLDNVRVNAIQIGPIEGTEGFDRLLPKKEIERMKTLIPLQRFGTAVDIANSVLFLVSDAASYVNGAILTVDGASQFTTGNMFGYPQALKTSKL